MSPDGRFLVYVNFKYNLNFRIIFAPDLVDFGFGKGIRVSGSELVDEVSKFFWDELEGWF